MNVSSYQDHILPWPKEIYPYDTTTTETIFLAILKNSPPLHGALLHVYSFVSTAVNEKLMDVDR